MRIKIVTVLIMFLLSMVGCESKGKQIANPKIGFEIKEFKLKYDDSSYSKSYSGEGTIVAVGAPELVKKPYLVLIRYEKIKGGDLTEDNKSILTIEVVDGIGKFHTYDSSKKKENKFEKPEYKFDIVGYMPLIPISSSSMNKIGFETKEFSLKYEEKTESIVSGFKMKWRTYTGEGTIIAVGNPELVKKPYIVLLRLERLKGGRETDADTKTLQHLSVVDGIGKFHTSDWDLSGIIFGKEHSKEKMEKPEYKIEILGFRPAEV